MDALQWMVGTLEAALLLAFLSVVLGLFACVRWWLRRPVSSQAEREGMYLAQQVAWVQLRYGRPCDGMKVRDAA